MMSSVSSLPPTDVALEVPEVAEGAEAPEVAASRRPGRPRDARADRAILEAALELAAADGLAGFSVDAVAQRAGVSKATIYRRWSTKEQMVMDAIHELAVPGETPDTGSLRGDLDVFFADICAGMQRGPGGDLMAQLVMAARTQPEVMAVLKQKMASRRRPLAVALERAIERGEIPASTDVEAAMDLLSGPVMFRFLVTHEPVDASFVQCVRDVVVDGLERGHCR
jgi:AcrR family transcriptional regulator